MKEFLLSEKSAALTILMTGGLKPEFYIRKRIFNYFQFLTKF